MIVGEAWGREEAAASLPFVGAAGHELRSELRAAGLEDTQCFFTNVIAERPKDNDFTNFLYRTSERKPLVRGLSPRSNLIDGCEKLRLQIDAVRPELIIGCGNIPLWALTDHADISSRDGFKYPGGITKWRGSQTYTIKEYGSIRFLPIIHPASVLREYGWKYINIHDLSSRAHRFLTGQTSWDCPTPIIQSTPTFSEAKRWLEIWINTVNSEPLALAVDIETWQRKAIVCIGLAGANSAICIPFFYFNQSGRCINYFEEENEYSILSLISTLLRHPNLQIVGQNYIYDYQYLSRLWGIYSPVTYDTMLMHHLCWPGTPKSLEYLASLYCEHYLYWKDESQEWDGRGGHEALWTYNCKDVRTTYDIHVELKKLIIQQNLSEQWSFQQEQWKLAAQVMQRGIRVDHFKMTEINLKLNQEAEKLETFLSSILPPDLAETKAGGPWYNSPLHSMSIFYDLLAISPVKHRRTGRPTFNYEAFDTLRRRSPWLTPVFDALESYRSIGVFRKNFLDILLGPDKRLHCNFNVGGTETFRWSSSKNGFGEGANFQTIPKGDEDQ
jgi:uracil-DNA glycosylase family 4